MQKKNHEKNGATAGNNGGLLRMIPLGDIEPSPDNPRQHFNDKKFAELVASIKQNGVSQPILVRPINGAKTGKAKFQIVAGERRYRASNQLGLKDIPAHIKAMSDGEASSARLVENLLREDLHPLDEADGFLHLKEELKLDVRGISQRVAKDARYVALRLALTNLIEVAREDFRKERLTLGHVLELCRYAPEIQMNALIACYETKPVQNKSKDGYDYVPDKTRPARHVRHLQDWLMQNIHLNLQKAPFKLDDGRLREDGLTCVNCPQRTGHDKLLFADIKSSDTCLNPLCFQAKLQQFVHIIKAGVEAKQGKPAALISNHYGSRAEGEGILGRDQYQILQKKADRCEYAEQCVYADGGEIGQVKWICREPGCKDHLGRVRTTYSSSSNGNGHTRSPETLHQRKQELFNIKVDEVVRTRVMGEAIKAFAWPLDRDHLNEAVKEFFRRIPTDDQQTICEVFGWGEEAASKLRFNDEAVLQELIKLDDDRLAQFLMLCSFAHYGANQHKNREVDQSAVVRLSQERGVNHTLIDAQARAELSPKKYKDAHEAYLKAVQSGEPAQKPVVYEQPQQLTDTPTTDGQQKMAGKMSQPGKREKAAKAAAG